MLLHPCPKQFSGSSAYARCPASVATVITVLAQVACCIGAVCPGEDMVYGSRKVQRTIIGTRLTGEFFCNLKSSMHIRKLVIKNFCKVLSHMCSVHKRMGILDPKVYFLDQNYVFR